MRLLSIVLLSFCFMSSAFAGSYETIMKAGYRYGISKAVLTRVATRESHFNCSPNNSRYHGPLQISKATARRFGYRGGPLNNCKAGLRYGLDNIAWCVSRYGNNPGAVVACHARGS